MRRNWHKLRRYNAFTHYRSRTLNEIFDIVILLSAIALILFYGELAIHKYQVRKEAIKNNKPVAAAKVTNEGLMAAGLVGAGVWLLIATRAGDSDAAMAVVIALLALGAVGSVWLWIRIRFGE